MLLALLIPSALSAACESSDIAFAARLDAECSCMLSCDSDGGAGCACATSSHASSYPDCEVGSANLRVQARAQSDACATADSCPSNAVAICGAIHGIGCNAMECGCCDSYAACLEAYSCTGTAEISAYEDGCNAGSCGTCEVSGSSADGQVCSPDVDASAPSEEDTKEFTICPILTGVSLDVVAELGDFAAISANSVISSCPSIAGITFDGAARVYLSADASVSGDLACSNGAVLQVGAELEADSVDVDSSSVIVLEGGSSLKASGSGEVHIHGGVAAGLGSSSATIGASGNAVTFADCRIAKAKADADQAVVVAGDATVEGKVFLDANVDFAASAAVDAAVHVGAGATVVFEDAVEFASDTYFSGEGTVVLKGAVTGFAEAKFGSNVECDGCTLGSLDASVAVSVTLKGEGSSASCGPESHFNGELVLEGSSTLVMEAKDASTTVLTCSGASLAGSGNVNLDVYIPDTSVESYVLVESDADLDASVTPDRFTLSVTAGASGEVATKRADSEGEDKSDDYEVEMEGNTRVVMKKSAAAVLQVSMLAVLALVLALFA